MERLYQKLPTEKEAAAIGVPLSAYAAQPPVEVWPDNRHSVELFMTMGNEWRHGMAGATGLDKSQLDRFFRLARTPRRQRNNCFRDLLTLERLALNVIHRKD